MSFSELQQQINSGWEGWKQKRHPVDPTRQRKKDLCVECGKKGYSVKMDYIGNKHTTLLVTRYDLGFFKCPRCGHVEKQYRRIEGRGTSGANSGRMHGGV